MTGRRTNESARCRWLLAVLVNVLQALREHRIGTAKAIILTALEVER